MTIVGNLVLASAKRARTETALTISGEVTVTGKVGAGVAVTITATGTLTVEGEVEAGAQITTKSQKGFVKGTSMIQNEAIILALESGSKMDLEDLQFHVAYKVSGGSAVSYTWPDDVDENTILVKVLTGTTVGGTPTWSAYTVADNSSDKIFTGGPKENDQVGPLKMQCYYYSLSRPTNGSGTGLETNPITEGTHYTIFVTDGEGNVHELGFTAWAGASNAEE